MYLLLGIRPYKLFFFMTVNGEPWWRWAKRLPVPSTYMTWPSPSLGPAEVRVDILWMEETFGSSCNVGKTSHSEEALEGTGGMAYSHLILFLSIAPWDLFLLALDTVSVCV